MKKFFVLLFLLGSVCFSFAQDSTNINIPPLPPTPKAKKWNTAALANRSNDHLLLQVGYDTWTKKPDSINTKGFSRSFNIYFMYDFPFKTNPHLSIGIGAGLSTSNIYFDKTYIDITGRNHSTLTFDDVSDTNHFKKYKLLTTFVEAPIELRYVSNPYNTNHSWKFAIGAKIGTMLAAGTKGKNLLNSGGQTINAYTQKEKAKRFFNSTRFSSTVRVGYGVFSLFAAYQLNSLIKEGLGPDVRPLSIGLTISGL